MSYTAYWHRSGESVAILHEGLTRPEAEEWLRSRSKATGQPVLGELVNENADPECGYFAITTTTEEIVV